MIGRLATARTPLNPTGQVEVRGELWQARLQTGTELPILTGAQVRIQAVEDLILLVVPAPTP